MPASLERDLGCRERDRWPPLLSRPGRCYARAAVPSNLKRFSPEVVDAALASALGWVDRGVRFPTNDQILALELLALRKQLEQARALVPRWNAMATMQRQNAARWREAGAAFDAHAERCEGHAEVIETCTAILGHVVKGDDGEEELNEARQRQ